MANGKIGASGVATIAAVAAIMLGIVDSMQTRAHNRLSVAPYLVVDYTMSARPGESIYRVEVSNEGVGPAIVEAMEITLPAELGGKKYPSWNEPVAILRQRGARVDSYWNYEGGEALGVQRSRQLINVVIGGYGAAELIHNFAAIYF
jgi:hypothetical protein